MIPAATISQKCRYALRAIFELALRDSPTPVKIQDIASAQAIPPRFLEVILAELRHAGFVASKRGNDGGYILARPANQLAIGEIISFFQGSAPATRAGHHHAPLSGDYAFSQMWQMITATLAKVYNNTTFADLVERELINRKNYVPNYII